MTDRSFQKLLVQASRAADKHRDLVDQAASAFVERYGITYNDVDADSIIDSLDYGGGAYMTVEECDRIMAELGHPRRPLAQDEEGRGEASSDCEDCCVQCHRCSGRCGLSTEAEECRCEVPE